MIAGCQPVTYKNKINQTDYLIYLYSNLKI